MASTMDESQALRPIPLLRSPSNREQTVYHSYLPGEVIWRTHGPLRLRGFVQSGEIELEYRVAGVPVRTSRLLAGDSFPPDGLRSGRLPEMVIARAVTDVCLGVLPELKQAPSTVKVSGRRGMSWVWPVLLLLLIVVLAWNDIVRISSGLFYLASRQGEILAPDDPRSMSLLQAAQRVDNGAAFAYNEEGYRWFRQNDLPDARASFQEALARDPANAPALNNLAITYFAQADLPLSARYLQQAVELAPDNPVVRYNLGVTQMQLDDPAKAIREFREAGFIDSKAALPLLQQAYLHQRLGDYVDAEQSARSAIQIDPSLAPAHLLLGMALYNQGREADALDSFKSTLTLEPGNRVAAFYQALILGHQKEYHAALPILHMLFISSTDDAETARILAEIDALYRFRAEPALTGP